MPCRSGALWPPFVRARSGGWTRPPGPSCRSATQHRLDRCTVPCDGRLQLLVRRARTARPGPRRRRPPAAARRAPRAPSRRRRRGYPSRGRPCRRARPAIAVGLRVGAAPRGAYGADRSAGGPPSSACDRARSPGPASASEGSAARRPRAPEQAVPRRGVADQARRPPGPRAPPGGRRSAPGPPRRAPARGAPVRTCFGAVLRAAVGSSRGGPAGAAPRADEAGSPEASLSLIED